MKFEKFILGLFSVIMTMSMGFAKPSEESMKAIEGKNGLFAVIDTTRGEIVCELFYKDTPLTVTNFVGLAEGTLNAAKGKHFYNGLKFHRVIENFMIQGGDPAGNGTGGPGYKFSDEPVEKYIFDKPGKLAMANSGDDTNGSQFFITHVPTDWLNYKHTIFGEVVTGQDVVNAVKQNDEIKSVTIVRQGADAEKFSAAQADFDRLVPVAAKAKKDFKDAQFNRMVEGFTKSSSGVYFKILENGSGSACGKRKTATVEYRGYLPSGQLFDVTKEFHPQGHEPLSFSTGAGEMIPGFDLMVQEMKLGETRQMLIPPQLAYGIRGVPQAGIPGNSYICFDVKLVKIK